MVLGCRVFGNNHEGNDNLLCVPGRLTRRRKDGGCLEIHTFQVMCSDGMKGGSD